MKKRVVLRDYQRRGIETISRLILKGRRKILAVAPTGAGKGTMAAHMLAHTARAGGRCLFLVHRREILLDIQERLHDLGIETGIIMGDRKPNRTAPVQLASVQTLVHERQRRSYDLMVVDEAHHYAAKEWGTVMAHNKPDALVGFTATPQRADGRPLGDVFNWLVDVVGYSELLSKGHIVPCRVLRPECPLGSDLAQDAAVAYMRYAPGTPAFIFVRSLEDARACKRHLSAAAVRVEVIDAFTRDADRQRWLAAMRAGELDVIVNYYTMTEGIDMPSVRTVVLARSCAHEGAYMQMVGRGLRPHPGKSEALILDLTGATYQHGLPLEDRAYSLKSRAMKRAGDVVEHRVRERPDAADINVLNMDLVEATAEQQQRYGKRRIDWSQVGLGKRSDQVIAHEQGVSYDVVRRMREIRNIPPIMVPVRTGIDWKTLDLTSKSDRELGLELGVSEDTVRGARMRFKIQKAYKGRGIRSAVDWDAQPLGVKTDKVIAAELGVSSSTVLMARRARGIPAVPQDIRSLKGVDWDAQPLGKDSDEVIAARLGVDKKTVWKERMRRAIPPMNGVPRKMHTLYDWEKVGLGTKPDLVLASELGVSTYTIRHMRAQYSIAPFGGQTRRGRRRNGPYDIDWEKVAFGKQSDAELAKALGVSVYTVRNERQKRGVLRTAGRPRKLSESSRSSKSPPPPAPPAS